MSLPISRPAVVRLVVAAVVAGCLLALPLYLPAYRTTQASLVLVYVMVGYGLNVLTGWTGKVSLGHTFFFAIGAYGSVIVQTRSGWGELAAGVVAVTSCGVIGWLLGRPILRFRGLHLALATLALGVLTPMLIRRLHVVTGGEDGLAVPPISFLHGTGLLPDQRVYYLCLVGVALAIGVYLWSTRALVGSSLRAIAEQEVVAQTLGIDTTSMKSQAFAVSAALAGGAGFCFAKVVGYLGTESFGLIVAIGFLTMIVVGGATSLLGPWLGAAFLVFTPYFAADINESAPAVFYAVILLFVVAVVPSGLAGAFGTVRLQLLRKGRSTS